MSVTTQLIIGSSALAMNDIGTDWVSDRFYIALQTMRAFTK